MSSGRDMDGSAGDNDIVDAGRTKLRAGGYIYLDGYRGGNEGQYREGDRGEVWNGRL